MLHEYIYIWEEMKHRSSVFFSRYFVLFALSLDLQNLFQSKKCVSF